MTKQLTDNDLEIILEAHGFDAKWRRGPSRRHRIRHTIFGCSPIPFKRYDARVDRIIEYGRVCPVCIREFPL